MSKKDYSRVEEEKEEDISCGGVDDTLAVVARVGKEEEKGGNGRFSGK